MKDEKRVSSGPVMLPVLSGPDLRAEADRKGTSDQIPRVDSNLTARDHLGHWAARWGIGRNDYRVEPGIYALGSPDKDSPVMASANYTLSFDTLRSALAGRNVWILVLDSDGINVWCAAGKGTFGTVELARRIALTRLKEVVDHRKIVVPQLGAPGIAAHEVRKLSGFKVVFGPVRAGDIPAFLDGGMKATPEMRKVTFTLPERLVLVPMELVPALRWSLPLVIALALVGGLGAWGFSFAAVRSNGTYMAAAYFGAVVSGAIVTPLLLPWLPGRSFSFKGALVGLFWAAVFSLSLTGGGISAYDRAGWLLSLPALSAFLAMNFTGASTLTSLSGVKKEMRYAIPLQAAGAAAGLIIWIAGHFMKGVA